MAELASATQLDELVKNTWFKNQHIKRRKQQLQTQPSIALEAPNQIITVNEETSLSVTSTNTRPISPSVVNAYDHEPSGFKQPGGAGYLCVECIMGFSASGSPLCLGVSDLPLASIPYDLDQFTHLHALPGDDHPNSLDQCLFPKCPG
ncbi:paired-like homeodomain transcription factor LEUTX [Myotis myotis]|uniref:Leucine twenty homeobox n=1 Tax=Myotis myotis TaxID=51298 RepID=A0A7J8AL16_MYOMY|nr:paired-like homeodomain transcription factor LEUTX [Myotis myotis]KAF6387243.1 leucine twenty homeobox [Myotis myotis]